MKRIFLGVSLSALTLLLPLTPVVAQNKNQRPKPISQKNTPAPRQNKKPATSVIEDPTGAYITSLVIDEVNALVAQGLLKGQQGDKGDPGQDAAAEIGGPVPISYNNNLPGNIAGFTELSGGDVTAQTSLNVNSGAPMEVDGPANFTSGITDNDLNVATIESPASTANFDGYDWTNASGRELKENFATVSPADILTKIDSLPVYTWNYKTENSNVVHMGPVAEDFYADFGLGDSSSSISTIDPAGVALAGIQGLDQKINSLLDVSWVLQALNQLGISIQQDIIKVETLAADFIRTKRLEVGSPGDPEGITIYDTVTGQPVCVFSANNMLREAAGKCATVNSVVSQAAPSANLGSPPAASSMPGSLDASDASSSASSAVDVLPRDLSSQPASTTEPTSDDAASSTTNNATGTSNATSTPDD